MPFEFIPFGNWTPDKSEFNTDGTEQALNVIRTTNGYRPFPSLEVFGAASVLPAGRTVGNFWGRASNGLVRQYIALAATEASDPEGVTANSGIYELLNSSGSLSWVPRQNFEGGVGGVEYPDVPGIGLITSHNRWRPAQVGDTLYVTNFENKLLCKDLTADTTSPNFEPIYFRDAAGDEIITDPTQVKVRYIAEIRGFLVGGYSEDPSFQINGVEYGDRLVPNRIRWASPVNASYWSLAGDFAALSDFNDLEDAGDIRGIVGGEYGVVICENGLFRMELAGPPNIWQFNRIERARGCLEPNSVVAANNIIYYLGSDGWRAFDGRDIKPIGAERFDRWFFDEADSGKLHTMTRAVDPKNQLILWGFQSGDSVLDVNDTILIYNYVLNQATYAKIDHSLLGTWISPGYTLDGLDTVSNSSPPVDPAGSPDPADIPAGPYDPLQGIDGLPASLDDSSWVGGEQSFGGFSYFGAGNNAALGSLSGTALRAQIDTSEQRWGGENRIRLQRVQAAIEGDNQTITIQASGRNRQGRPRIFGPEKSLTGDGFYVFNGDARYPRVRANITGEWRDATGVFVWFEPTSER